MLSRKRWILLLLLLVVAGLAALLLWPSPRPVAPAALPSPNGYDDLLKAAAARQGAVDASAASTEELRGFVEDNREALRLVRVGLSRACQVPLEYSQTYMTTHMNDLASWKALTLALKAEGALAERESRLADAVKSHLDGMRLGQHVARGGLLIDQLVGISCQGIGLNSLMDVRTNLSAPDWREVIQTLEAIEREQEPLPSMVARDRDWGRRAMGAGYVVASVVDRFTSRSLDVAYDKFRLKHLNISARRRLLLAEAAIRSFWLENHRYPDGFRELVPALLPAAPADPYTETNLIYRLKGDSFLLYSAGPDGKDDGGTPFRKGAEPYPPKGDIFLDSPSP